MKIFVKISLLALACFSAFAMAADPVKESAKPEVKLYIVSPQNGATVPQNLTVVFGLSGMGVAPAGVDKPHTGHHHLIIDGELPVAGVPMGTNVMHFGGGQTETTLHLEKGEHTLQLVMGNFMHVPLDPLVASEKITVTVE